MRRLWKWYIQIVVSSFLYVWAAVTLSQTLWLALYLFTTCQRAEKSARWLLSFCGAASEWSSSMNAQWRTGGGASTSELQCFYDAAWVIWLQLWQGGLKLWKVLTLLLTGGWEPLGKHERCLLPHCFVLLTLHCESDDCMQNPEVCSHGIFGTLCYLEHPVFIQSLINGSICRMCFKSRFTPLFIHISLS